jgi:hypothetical protein
LEEKNDHEDGELQSDCNSGAMVVQEHFLASTTKVPIITLCSYTIPLYVDPHR